MIFSRAVQYGAKWMPELFLKGMRLKNPKYLNLSYIDAEKFDSELIFGVYDFLIGCCAQASYSSQKGIYHDPEEWTCGSFDVVKNGLKNRFVREKADLLSMLGGEGD
jgi:hypothetical protein